MPRPTSKISQRDPDDLFATRFIRLFAYGSLSVVLVFYLIGVGLSEPQIGMLLTLTLVGDTVVSLVITTRADRIGRRRMLIVGAVLMVVAGLVFAGFHQFAEHSTAIIGALPNEVFALLLVIGAIALFAIRKFLRASFGLVDDPRETGSGFGDRVSLRHLGKCTSRCT